MEFNTLNFSVTAMTELQMNALKHSSNWETKMSSSWLYISVLNVFLQFLILSIRKIFLQH